VSTTTEVRVAPVIGSKSSSDSVQHHVPRGKTGKKPYTSARAKYGSQQTCVLKKLEARMLTVRSASNQPGGIDLLCASAQPHPNRDDRVAGDAKIGALPALARPVDDRAAPDHQVNSTPPAAADTGEGASRLAEKNLKCVGEPGGVRGVRELRALARRHNGFLIRSPACVRPCTSETKFST
jgi:hypothetical protein